MKCLSLWQPWASLIEVGAKTIETRSWSTRYRGPIAIHAAKRWSRDQLDFCRWSQVEHALRGMISMPRRPPREALPFGVIVAVADLVDCYEIDAVNLPSSPTERAFGDYTPGRFAWQLANIRAVPYVPLCATQGLFPLPRYALNQLPVSAARATLPSRASGGSLSVGPPEEPPPP
jgi:activating signal cointegrator 1